MNNKLRITCLSLILFQITIFYSPALRAEDAQRQATGNLPSNAIKPNEISKMELYPGKITLNGIDEAAQLIVTAFGTDGRLYDLTGEVQYQLIPEAPKSTDSTRTQGAVVAQILTNGRVLPLANGSGKILATYGDKIASIPIEVNHMTENLPINFANQVVPVFTKLTCNSGGCHGKASGQNGFKLSLLGFEPETDFTALVKEGRGRRLMPSSPENSLLLVKAVGAVAHGGGKKMEKDSDEYKLVRRWIAAGMPYGKPTDPTVTKISIYPDHRIMPTMAKQQFAVYAHYSDGTILDITRRAQYESNDQEIAIVDTTGLVRTLNLSGEAAIMARYQGKVATFRATVPQKLKTPNWTFKEQTIVDRFTAKKWRELNLVPSDLASDENFIRRVYLDVTGTLPTPKQVEDFVNDKQANKRDQLVDRLVDSNEYAYYFANKWADILRVKRGQGGQNMNRAEGTFAFHAWIKESITNDKPYDEFVREILLATGDVQKSPPSVWYQDLQKPEQFVDDTAQVFLGLRIACANCHHHPYEKWSQDDYWGMASFFARVSKKVIQVPTTTQQINRMIVYTRSDGNVINKRTNKVAATRALDGPDMNIPADEDPREALVNWMTDPKNPFFAKAVANRYWAHFFGRGIVDPLDDMRITNPPSNPELLDTLAKELIDHKYSLKHMVKVICKSRTYQLSAVPNSFNQNDKQTYARYYPKRLSAEVLLDAISEVTASPTQFNGLPTDKFAPNRALKLPDESFSSYFLDVFGRPQRISACECERVNEANLAQALHLLNSDEVQNKLARANSRSDMLVKDKRSDQEKVQELFLWAFARKPSSADLDAALSHLKKHEKDKKQAYENIIWALINTKEFLFNQ